MRKKLLPSTLLNIVKGNIVYTPEGCGGEARTKYRVTQGFHISREEFATENAGEVVFCVSSVGNGGDGESWELQLNHFYLVENYPLWRGDNQWCLKRFSASPTGSRV